MKFGPVRLMLVLLLLVFLSVWKIATGDQRCYRLQFLRSSSTGTLEPGNGSSGYWTSTSSVPKFSRYSCNASQELRVRRPCQGCCDKLERCDSSGSLSSRTRTYQQLVAVPHESSRSSVKQDTCMLADRAIESSGQAFALKKFAPVVSDEASPVHIVAAFGGCFLVSCALLCPCLQRKRKTDSKSFPLKDTSNSISSLGGSSVNYSISTSSAAYSPSLQQPLQASKEGRAFTLAELSKATKNFSPTCKIGQGGFGTVYKGKLQDGTIVAIKRAKKKVYDSRLTTEFRNEVGMLLDIDHRNLVKMIGYLEENDERILVVEYISNGNLREHLDGTHGTVLDLSVRLDICIDVAHALTYLHLYAGKPIIHRDVKPSNILLTENFRAKVADFGYSRMGPLEIGETHVSTEVKGTAGYLDPEYLKKFQLNEKSDVYSFGVLLVEIITGKRPIDEKQPMKERVAIRWAFRKFLDGKVIEILDPRLKRSSAACMVVERISELAFQCAAPTKQDRPCMKNVAEVLWDIRKDYQKNLQDDLQCSSSSELQKNKSSGRLSQEMKSKSLNLKDNRRIESSTR